MKRIVTIMLALALICAVFGCASKAAARDEAYSNAAPQAYADSYVAEPEAETSLGFREESKTANAQVPALSNRKIIRNANMAVETLAFDTFVDQLSASIGSFGGYVESSSVGNRGYKNGQQLRYARYTIRIPAEQLDTFLNTVSDLGNVTELNTGLKDVTTSYVDSEQHLKALRTEQDALMEILAKAETIEDIITVQDRLTHVRYEIESYEAILRTYDDQVALSSVSLTVNEVEKETPVEKETFGQEVSRRFKESLSDVGDSCKSCAAGFLGNSPIIFVTLLILGGIALIVILVIRGVRKHNEKKRAKILNNIPKE